MKPMVGFPHPIALQWSGQTERALKNGIVISQACYVLTFSRYMVRYFIFVQKSICTMYIHQHFIFSTAGVINPNVEWMRRPTNSFPDRQSITPNA